MLNKNKMIFKGTQVAFSNATQNPLIIDTTLV